MWGVCGGNEPGAPRGEGSGDDAGEEDGGAIAEKNSAFELPWPFEFIPPLAEKPPPALGGASLPSAGTFTLFAAAAAITPVMPAAADALPDPTHRGCINSSKPSSPPSLPYCRVTLLARKAGVVS